MVKRLLKDESGVALGLAIIMIVLIGVMGAGLLVFVRNDLEAVVEVNQGQKALNFADAGVQAAKRHLRSDTVPAHYDSNSDRNSEWAYVPPSGGTAGKTLNLPQGTTRITIQYLLPSTNSPQLDDEDYAPELVPDEPSGLTDYPGKDYFKVTAEGTTGNAKRKVEAILYTSKLDVPTAYYTPKDIDFRGNVNISGVSFFARGDIRENGNVNIDRSAPTLYGDWDTTKFNPPSNSNTVPRTDDSGQPITGTGLAAEGTVDDVDGNKGIYDYDSSTTPKFCRKPAPASSSPPCSTTVDRNDPNPSNTISYPFNPDAEPDLDLLREEAQRQNNYKATNTDIDNGSYPDNSTNRTVFYVNGQGGDVKLDTREDPAAKGTIVVENGNVDMTGQASFNGVVIITGDGVDTGTYKSAGNPELEGFVLADGDMTIRGDSTPFSVTEDFTQRPGFYGVRQWSWRECYSEDCS